MLTKQGQFIYSKYALAELRAWRVSSPDGLSPQQLEQLPHGLHSMLHYQLSKLRDALLHQRRELLALLPVVLSMLVTAQEPLTAEQLSEMCLLSDRSAVEASQVG